MVIQASAKTVLYFLNIFEDVLYIILLVTTIICARSIIKAVKATRKPKEYPHKYVHPLPDPADRRNAYRCSVSFSSTNITASDGSIGAWPFSTGRSGCQRSFVGRREQSQG